MSLQATPLGAKDLAPGAPLVSGLARDIEIIELLATAESWESGGLGVIQIAQITSRDKGQISRCLKTLLAAGLVDRDATTRRYRVGVRFYSIALQTQEAFLVMVSQRFLLEAVAFTQETAHLNILRGSHLQTLRTEEARTPLRDATWDGRILRAIDTASGRAILATFTEAELKNWFEEHQNPVEANEVEVVEGSSPQITTYRRLSEELTAVRERGYAIVNGELTAEIVDAAAAISDGAGRVVGAISVGMPEARVGSQFAQLGLVVARVAQDFTRELGGSPFMRDAGVTE
ncbi:MAG: IclR family transcriptional regulator [Actinomycetales bacterium]|nr:IclR family transcriptional regulator [Actinomycetales bacterium]